MGIRRLLKWLLGGLAAALLALALWDFATYDSKAWRSDFARLKRDMAQGYANLDWVREHRKVDVAALARSTEEKLDGANGRIFAWLALKGFIQAFADPHFRVEDHGSGASGSFVSSASPAPKPQPAGESCGQAGYDEADHGFRFPFAKLPGWRVLAEGNFPTGVSGSTGVVRIAQLGEDRYYHACEKAFRPGLSRTSLKLATRKLLQAELRGRIALLKRAGARRILVDLTGNGGGTEWVNEVVALFTARTLQRQPPRLVGPACDRSAIWEGKAPPCPVFAAAPAEPALLRGTGEWGGPLLVLADRDTGSASEDFVAWVKDGGAGRIVGERTAGAGCGYVNGGTRTALTVLPLDVRMPNCARFMKNGLNEIEGIPPDVELKMDDPDNSVWALARLLG
jgi:hypothetical protein